MMIKRIAYLFGAIFVLVGLAGFVPAISPHAAIGTEDRLLGVFAVDLVHNLVHIVTGLVAIGAGLAGDLIARTYFRVFGIVYGLVALAGFGYGKAPLLGVMANNLPDAALHMVIAVVALFLGFGHLLDRFEHRHDEGTHHAA